MPGIFNDEPESERRKRRLFEAPQIDPTAQARKAGRPHFNRVLGGVLMPDSMMPIGPHGSKTLRQVPAVYLAWVQAQPWAQRWTAWQPVADYLTRWPLPDSAQEYVWPAHIAFVSPLQACTPTQEWNHPQHALLTCHPDSYLHEDKFHTFALGALGLRPSWYDKALQAYRLTPQKRWQAIQAGAAEVKARGGMPRSLTFVRVDDDGQTRCTKHCYPSEHAARSEIDRILTSRRRHRPDYLRTYECPECGFWHLTRQKLPHES